MKKFIVASVVGLAFLAGCSSDASGSDGGNKVTVDNTYSVPIPGTDDPYIAEFRLNDGTRCVVVDGYQMGNVACDWGSSNGVPSN